MVVIGYSLVQLKIANQLIGAIQCWGATIADYLRDAR
jgi:hypothetical protein